MRYESQLYELCIGEEANMEFLLDTVPMLRVPMMQMPVWGSLRNLCRCEVKVSALQEELNMTKLDVAVEFGRCLACGLCCDNFGIHEPPFMRVAVAG